MNIKILLVLLFNSFFVFTSTSQIQNAQQSLSYADIDSLVYLYYKARAYDQAILLMEEGRAKAKIDFGTQDSIYAEYTAYLGFFYKKKSQYDKALPYLIEAKDIRATVLGKKHPDFAKAVNNLASLYQKMGNYDKALPLYIQAKNIRAKALGTEHSSYAGSLNDLALLYQKMGDYDKAIPLLIQANSIYKNTLGDQHPTYATAINNLAFVYKQMGKYDQALPLYIESRNIREQTLGNQHPTFAHALNNLAQVYEKMENYEQALLLHTETKNIFEKTLGKNHMSYATVLNNLGNTYIKIRDYDQGLILFEQAKDIRAKILGEEHPDYANSLHNLASLYIDLDRHEEAMPLLKRAKEIRKKVLGEKHPDYAETLSSLAIVHAKNNNYEQALILSEQANEIYKNTLGEEHPSFLNFLTNTAILYIQLENYEKAWSLFLKVIEKLSKKELDKHIDTSWVSSLANAEYASNTHLREMLSTLFQVFFLLEQDSTINNAKEKKILITDLAFELLSQLYKQILSENDKLRMLALNDVWLDKSLKLLEPTHHAYKAFNISDQNKSVLLLQATQSEESYRLGELPDSLALQDKKRLQQQSELQAQLLEQRPKLEKDSLRNLLIEVNQDIEDFLSLVKDKYPKYYDLKYDKKEVNAKAIQQYLAPHTALLEYAISDSIVHIFYIDQKHIQWVKSFIPLKQLSKRIKHLHNALSNYQFITNSPKEAYLQYTQNAHWFYQKLLEPVLQNKNNINNLIIITDRKLGHLPFETFLVESAPQQSNNYQQLHYVLNDYTVSYNYSASLWKENIDAPAPKNNGQLLAMAANYEQRIDSSVIGFRLPTEQALRAALKPLPAARHEVKALEKKFQGFFAFDSLASENMVKKLAPDYAVIHLAMHGILNHNQPALSSLAFTESRDSLESNFWQAHEISKSQLNANLVVLSACQTGFGKFEAGNGIASLARAFMYAGAPALVVSLWQVNDQATSKTMDYFYKNLAAGMKKDEALAQAKLAYIQSSKGIAGHPAFWSPFIQIGNTQAVQIATKGIASIWVITFSILGIALLLALVWLLKSRKNSEPKT